MNPTDTIIALEKALEAGPTPSWAAQPEEIGLSYIRIRGTALGERFKVANVLHPTYDDQSSEQLWQRDKAETRANAAFIAAANPLAIRTLLDAHASALRDAERLKEALRKIAAIEDSYTGTDWDEINVARELARSALDDSAKGAAA